MNLPADADDLSKYAPALLNLKSKGEGFVLPEGYFEEFTDRVVSMTTIPSESGLVVPENYFENSAEEIIAKTSFGEPVLSDGRRAQDDKNSSSEFVLPENYFEEFPSLIEALVQLPAEDGLSEPGNYFDALGDQLESRIAIEDLLPKSEGETPEGYFNQMENELQVHIALDNLKQEEGFVIPENYFGDLADRILAGTSVVSPSGAEENNAADSLDPNVPDGYFEELPDRVLARVAQEDNEKPERGRIVIFAEWTKKYRRPVSVAASVALLIVSGWYFTRNTDNGTGDLKNNHGVVLTNGYRPGIIPRVGTPTIDTVSHQETPVMVASVTPKKPKVVKPEAVKEVKVQNEEIIAQADQMDESMVMDFVAESNVVTPTEEVLDPAMMEYLMNDNAGLDGFTPVDKK